jgi:hypothetical protein
MLHHCLFACPANTIPSLVEGYLMVFWTKRMMDCTIAMSF